MSKFGKKPSEAPATGNLPEANVPAPIADLPSGVISPEAFQAMQEQLANMQEMMLETGDANKIRAFNRRVSRPLGYCFNMGLWPISKEGLEEREAVILSTRLVKNNVFGAKSVEQVLELVLDDADCPKNEEPLKKLTVNYDEFTKRLRRTPKIEAKSLTTVDGSPIASFEDENGSKKLAVPTKEMAVDEYEGRKLYVKVATPCTATLPYKGKDYAVELKFLNM